MTNGGVQIRLSEVPDHRQPPPRKNPGPITLVLR
jgi:hypothetical protein